MWTGGWHTYVREQLSCSFRQREWGKNKMTSAELLGNTRVWFIFLFPWNKPYFYTEREQNSANSILDNWLLEDSYRFIDLELRYYLLFKHSCQYISCLSSTIFQKSSISWLHCSSFFFLENIKIWAEIKSYSLRVHPLDVLLTKEQFVGLLGHFRLIVERHPS